MKNPKWAFIWTVLLIYPLILVYEIIYSFFYKSIDIFIALSSIHFVFYALAIILVCTLLFSPIKKALKNDKFDEIFYKKIDLITRKISFWVAIIGIVNVLLTVLPLFIELNFYSDSNEFRISDMPFAYKLSVIPNVVFVYIVFPVFIAYFLSRDFIIRFKNHLTKAKSLVFRSGNQKAGNALLVVFLILGLIPSILLIMELETSKHFDFQKFSNTDANSNILIDRIVTTFGFLYSLFLITRAFTKPVNLLLESVNQVKQGDFTVQAPVVTKDEIGKLTEEFNAMVRGLLERERIRDVFGKYVSEEVASKILENGIDFAGEERIATILVTDIANYTSISEGLNPKEIIALLNEYFADIVGIIEKHNGNVNKYIGDSVFAMFNVPLDDADHALKACLAAKEIEALTKSKKYGRNIILTTRIGINTGMVVAGNLGTQSRMEYTIIGDEVNIAARLEQLNKVAGTQILLGPTTAALVKHKISLRRVGSKTLKGKQESIDVFTLV